MGGYEIKVEGGQKLYAKCGRLDLLFCSSLALHVRVCRLLYTSDTCFQMALHDLLKAVFECTPFIWPIITYQYVNALWMPLSHGCWQRSNGCQQQQRDHENPARSQTEEAEPELCHFTASDSNHAQRVRNCVSLYLFVND